MRHKILATMLVIGVASAAHAQTATGEKPHASATKGAVAGGVAGHMMGGHTKSGAVAGAMVGHHMRKKEMRRQGG